MTFFRVMARAALVGLMAAGSFAVATPSLAGPAEVELLKSYIGTWKGRGTLVGANTETVVCNMTLSPGNQDRVTYVGRCALAGQQMSVRGTIAYIDAARRYEAAMTTGTTFSPAPAIGQRSGDSILFKMRERGTDDEGNDMTITADIALRPSQLLVEFNVVFNNSGDTIHATVPFTK